ncbi:MAG: hypothetical protein ACLQFW_13215, partial [Xanthobacteraceae bacterium]
MTPEDMEAQIAAIAEDNAAIEQYRAKFGDEKAAQFAADLYKLRRTPAPATGGLWPGTPRSIIVLIAIWVGLLETADKLPRLLLAYPGYEATLAEYQAKMMQPDLTQAQLEKARNEAKASAYQPDLTSVQLDKSKLETKAASFQPALTAAQAFKAEVDAVAGGAAGGLEGDMSSYTRLHNMFDLLDPEHPNLISRGVLEPDLAPLTVEVMLSEARKAKNARKSDAPAPAPPKAEAKAEPPPTAKPAPSEPTPAPTPLRTPAAFDCAKASMGVDYVICASPELMDAEARLEDALHAAHAAKGDQVKLEQWVWIKRYGADCGLPLKGRPA